jgi:hypothetical protein
VNHIYEGSDGSSGGAGGAQAPPTAVESIELPLISPKISAWIQRLERVGGSR